MPAASSKARWPRRSSPRRAIPTRRPWSIPCPPSATPPRPPTRACARSRASCPRLPPTRPVAASIHAARRCRTSAVRRHPMSRSWRPMVSCGAIIMADKLLELDDLAVHFTVGGALRGGTKILKAVDGVSLDVKPGECLGLVGESGCGKSTLALAIMGLIPPTHGGMALNGQAISGPDRLATARPVQMVFQDPYASLNPPQTLRRTLADPLRLHGVTNRREVDQPVMHLMAKVRLRP